MSPWAESKGDHNKTTDGYKKIEYENQDTVYKYLVKNRRRSHGTAVVVSRGHGKKI